MALRAASSPSGASASCSLSALVVGQESHAAYPLAGVNAAYLAAELTAEIEFAPELGEEEDGELAAPPTVLGSRDLKAQYNVTIPGAVWTYWNVLLHRRSTKEVLETTKTLARRALDRAAARMAERAACLARPVPRSGAWADIPILTYAELRDAAPCAGNQISRRASPLLGEGLRRQGDLDLPTRSRRLVEETWAASGLKGPAVVLGFGAMPYPAVPWPAEAGATRAAIEAAMAQIAAAFGVSIGAVNYFPAIADMSFIGPVDAADLAEAARQTPLWGSSIRWDFAQGATPGIPIVNIGPWGRDYHPLAGARSHTLCLPGPARSGSGRRDESAGRVTAGASTAFLRAVSFLEPDPSPSTESVLTGRRRPGPRWPCA